MAGYDFEVIKLILQLKFTLANRSNLGGFQNLSKKKKKKSSGSISGLIFYQGLMGLALAAQLIVLRKSDPLLSISIYMVMVMLFSLVNLVTEFSNSFLDTTDLKVLMPAPVERKVINLSRNLYVLLFYGQFQMIMLIPGVIIVSILMGVLSGLMLIISNMLSLMFIIAFTSILYGSMLRFFRNETLKNVLGVFQMLASGAGAFGFQIFIRLSNHLDKVENINSVMKYLVFNPSSWFAAPVAIFAGKPVTAVHWICIGIGLAVSILGYIIYIKLIAPYYERDMLKLNVSSKKGKKAKKARDSVWSKLFENYEFSPYYDVSVKLLSKDRKSRNLLFPAVAMSIIISIAFPIFFMHKFDKQLWETKTYLLLYFPAVMTATIATLIFYSEHFKACYMFKSLPLDKPRKLYIGAYIACLTRYILPTNLFAGIVFLILWKGAIWLDVLIIILNSVLFSLMFPNLTPRYLPFSRELVQGEAGRGDLMILLISAFCITVAVTAHYLATIFRVIYPVILVLQMILLYISARAYGNVEWKDVE